MSDETVSLALAELSNRLENLHTSIGELETSLNLVLSPDTPSNTASNTGPDTGVPMVDSVEELQKSVNRATSNIQGITARLSL